MKSKIAKQRNPNNRKLPFTKAICGREFDAWARILLEAYQDIGDGKNKLAIVKISIIRTEMQRYADETNFYDL